MRIFIGNISWSVAAVFGLHLKKNEVYCREKESGFDSSSLNNCVSIDKDLLNKELEKFRHRHGIPGLCFMTSANGQSYQTSIGFADVENRVPCKSTSVMRIASISKPLTSVAILKLWEEGKVDLHKPIQEYVHGFPVKEYGGAPVPITLKQLLSHTGGIRTYNKKLAGKEGSKNPFDFEEYYIRDHYKSISESLKLFQDDDLIAEPGTTHLYTTFGWTLVSAAVEGVSGVDFLQYMKEQVFDPLHMTATVPEFNDILINNRSRCTEEGDLFNTPYVDNSYKWGGGGFLSTVEDLVQFGNSLLLSYNEYQRRTLGKKAEETEQSKFILKPSTVNMMWTPCTDRTKYGYRYSLGWMIADKRGSGSSAEGSSRADIPLIVYHSGGSVGASSILVIIPGPVSVNDDPDVPKGVVLALLVNLQGVVKVEEVGKTLGLHIYKQILNN